MVITLTCVSIQVSLKVAGMGCEFFRKKIEVKCAELTVLHVVM